MSAGMSHVIHTAGSRPASGRLRISLVSEFQLLIDDVHVSVPHGVQRVLAFLATAGRPVARSRLAGELWLDVPEERARGNLRSALWRLNRVPRPIVRSVDDSLTLERDVDVDLAELTELMLRLVHAPDPASLSSLPQLVAATDLLPGWEDEWIVVERERFRELRLHALERAGEILLERGDIPGAVHAALAAAQADPFRDSAQRLLVRAHLQEGNAVAALGTYRSFRYRMLNELGIEPSESLKELVAGLRTMPAAPTAR